MRTPAVLLLALCLPFSGTSRAAAAGAPPAYDAKSAPLDDLSKDLLSDSGYEIRDDGRVWDKISEAAVSRDDMPYVLSRLASARRLKALLELNNIITRYDAERKLTPEDKEAVRTIARKAWPVFGVGPRHDFRAYFSVEELEALDKIPMRFETMTPGTMKDPEPESVTADAAPAPSAAAAVPAPAPAPAPAPVPAPAPAPAAVPIPAPVPAQAAAPAPAALAPEPAKTVPTLAPMMDAPSLKRPSPFAAVPAAPVAPPVSSIPAPAVVPAPAAAPPAPAAAPAPALVAAAPAAAPVTPPPAAAAPPPVATPDLGVLKPWTPPAGSTATAAAAVAAPAEPVKPAAPPAPPPAPEPPKPAAVTAADYEAFVAAGPYTKEGKELLVLLGKRAPDYALPLLRRTVVGALPQIVVDGTRTGEALRAGLIRGATDSITPPVVALSPGPVMVEIKKGLFGRHDEVVLFESPDAWRALGVAPPPLAAFKGDAAPASVENGDWGPVKVYADGSRRGAYSPAEQAGELLEQLLRLGLAREGLDASEYAARRWARTARLLFSARLKDETRQDAFLDPDRRAELRGWLDRGDEEDDGAISAWAGARTESLDPRRGPPEAARAYEAASRATCARAALEDALVAAVRRRVKRVAALEALADAGVVDDAAAKGAAESAVGAEAAERARLLASPPPCAAPDPAREESLRKAALVLAEAVRAERSAREAKAGGEHAL